MSAELFELFCRSAHTKNCVFGHLKMIKVHFFAGYEVIMSQGIQQYAPQVIWCSNKDLRYQEFGTFADSRFTWHRVTTKMIEKYYRS
jgi:hypothetical protein